MTIFDRIRLRRRRVTTLLLVGALAMAAAGCDAASSAVQDVVDSGPDVEDDPAAALQEAVAALGEWSGLEAELSIDIDDAVRAEIVADGDLTAEEVELIFGSTLIVRANGVDDPGDAGFETSLVVDGGSVFDLRVNSEERIFVRVDFETLSSLSAESDLADLDELVVAARMFGLGDVAQAAADGRWIELIGLDDVMELAGEPSADEPEVDEAELEALNTRVAATLERFVRDDVEVAYVGSEDAGERVRVTTTGAALEALADEIGSEFDQAGLLDDVGAGDLDELDVDPDLTVSLDAWIDGGELRQIAFDLSTIDDAEEIPGEALIVVTMEEFTGSIAEPDDVEPFDVLSLVGAFFGGVGGDPFGDDPFADPEAEFGEEPAAEFDDEPAGEFDDEPAGDGDEIADFDDSDLEAECIDQAELDELAEFAGEDVLAEFEELVELGFLELC